MRSRPEIGLALGGGAARGISHVGVLQVLEENEVPVRVVAGTSMGAIVGAIFILEGNTTRLVRRLYDFMDSEAFQEAHFDSLRERREEEDPGWLETMTGLLRRGLKYSLSLTRQSIISREVFERLIEALVPDVTIEQMPLPFAAISLDVVSGEEVIWTRGSLREALWASSAIPGFFPPLERDGQILVDGAWTNAVPVGPARALGAERVIAVDISREVEEIVEYKRGISLILRAAVLASKHFREFQLKSADLVLRPEVGHIHWADFSNPEQIIQKGRDATLLYLDQVRECCRWPQSSRAAALGDRLRGTYADRIRPRLLKITPGGRDKK